MPDSPLMMFHVDMNFVCLKPEYIVYADTLMQAGERLERHAVRRKPPAWCTTRSLNTSQDEKQ